MIETEGIHTTIFQVHPVRRVICNGAGTIIITQRSRWAWKIALRVQYPGFSLRRTSLKMLASPAKALLTRSRNIGSIGTFCLDHTTKFRLN